MNQVEQSPAQRLTPTLGSSSPVVAVGEAAILGASWLLLQQILVQLLGFGSKVAVTRLVSKEDIGWGLLALSFCSFLSVMQPASLGDVLIQRQRHFRRWANSAFWLSMVAATAMLIAGAIVATITGFLFHTKLMFVLVLCGSLTSVLTGAVVVWSADLSIRFRFRSLAVISTVTALILALLTVFMALLHMGALTLVVPGAIAALATMFIYAKASGFWPHGRLHFRRWKFLVGDSLILGAVGFLGNVTMQADNFCIGIYQSKSALAIYGLGYSLSFQIAQLAGKSLRGVMLPAFSGISDDVERREKAYLRSIQLVSLICMPACILLAPAAPALVRFIFSREWDDSSRLMQIFLLTMGFAITGGIAVMTIQARGLYKWCLAITGIDAVVFVAVVWPLAALYDVTHVAVGVCIVYAVFGTVHPIIASFPSSRSTKWRIFEAVVAPFGIALIGAGAGWLVAWRLEFAETDLRFGIISGFIGVTVYLGLARLLQRESVSLAMQRLGSIAGRLRRN